jgi:hypothetical protein
MTKTKLVLTPGANGHLYENQTLRFEDFCRATFLANPEKPGRIATLPELVQGRTQQMCSLAFADDTAVHGGPLQADPLWGVPISTRSGIFIGYDARDRLKVVLAHGDHPLDKNRDVLDDAIPRKEFYRLIEGQYGPVDTFEIEDLSIRATLGQPKRFSYDEADKNPVLKALLGSARTSYIAESKRFHINFLENRSKKEEVSGCSRFGWDSSLHLLYLDPTTLDLARFFRSKRSPHAEQRVRGFHLRLHPITYSIQNTLTRNNVPVFTSKIEVWSPHQPAKNVLFVEGSGALIGTRDCLRFL